MVSSVMKETGRDNAENVKWNYFLNRVCACDLMINIFTSASYLCRQNNLL